MTDTYTNNFTGEHILCKVSMDGGNSYVHPALINSTRGITFTTSTNSDEITDQTNLSAPAKTVRYAKSVDTKIDGAGTLDANSVLIYTQWAASGAAYPVKLVTNFGPTANSVSMTVTGPYMLTSFQITGDFAKSATCTLTLEQADIVTVTTP